jgi:hypothetical protein
MKVATQMALAGLLPADLLSEGGPPIEVGELMEERADGRMPGPLDPLELALLLEAAEDGSGLDRDERSSGDEADDDDEDDREP